MGDANFGTSWLSCVPPLERFFQLFGLQTKDSMVKNVRLESHCP